MDDEQKARYPVRTEGAMYQNLMPTEKLQIQLDSVKEELLRTRKLLAQALELRCPDPNCRNCRRWNRWYSDWGRDWYRCPECAAGPGKPCWDKRAPQGQLVRGRPHQRRKSALDPLPEGR